MPMNLLVCKKACFNTNYFDLCITSVCVYLLQDYKDILSYKILSGLPPTRRIKHQIDLVLITTIPNQPAFKSNPERLKKNFKGKWRS